MKKISYVFFFSILALCVISLPVHAEDASDEAVTVTPSALRGLKATIKQERAEMKDAIKASKEAALDEKCKEIESKVEEKTTKFDENKSAHFEKYTHMKVHLANISTQLKAKGLDTTKLDADSIILNTKIDKFVTDFETYIAKLKESKTYACGHSDGEFRSSLQKARTAILPVRQDVIDIKNFYQTTIRPDLIALRIQLGKLQPSEGLLSPSPVATQAAQ